MKRRILVVAILPLLVLALGGVSQAWQGRMGGMGDPYGLVSDESDFLIHPAKIAKGEGIRFYGNYRFTYRDMFDEDIIGETLGFGAYSLDLSGKETAHDALVGAGFPLGPGRMGLFFTYSGRRGDSDGAYEGVTPPITVDLKRDLDDYALRILYGMPVGSFRLGGELGIAYRQEEHESSLVDLGIRYVNYWNLFTPLYFALPSFAPYDSAYWEIPFKVGVEGALGPIDVAFSLRGGWIVSGDNTLKIVTPTAQRDMDGDVQGWRIGGDLWARYPLADNLSMPLIVRVDYQDKKRDGDYQDVVDLIATKTKEQTLQIMAGGGVDWRPVAGTQVGAGIYYSYLQQKTDFLWNVFELGDQFLFDQTDWPDVVEHRGTLVLTGERELSSMVALRMGLNFFLGWATEDQQARYLNTSATLPGPYDYLIDYSTDGLHWGIGGSLGATFKFQRFSFEPFVSGGYQSLKLSGDGSLSGSLPLSRDEDRDEWQIGGGVSILFDL
jgi:DNA-binding cell septation regulator SpoVG